MAKKGQVFKKYSPEFKLSVILDIREHYLGYVETSNKYGINSHSRILNWERKYLEVLTSYKREKCLKACLKDYLKQQHRYYTLTKAGNTK